MATSITKARNKKKGRSGLQAKHVQHDRRDGHGSPPSPRGNRRSTKRGGGRSRSRSKEALPPRLVLTTAPHSEVQQREPKKVRVEMHPRPAHQTRATLLTMKKNNQGEGKSGQGFCLAALLHSGSGSDEGSKSGRLIRLVPGIGHFWAEEDLPPPLRDMHSQEAQACTKLLWEPHWQFRPVVVGFEAGTLPDAVTGPHRTDDVVSRNLEHLGDVEDLDALDEQLARLACNDLEEAWPSWAWATPRGLRPGADVASLVLCHGSIKWVWWRPQASPLVDIQFRDNVVERLPYAAHRLHGSDRGFKMLEFLRAHRDCVMMLGLSRTFSKVGGGVPQCPILLLRVFPVLKGLSKA